MNGPPGAQARRKRTGGQTGSPGARAGRRQSTPGPPNARSVAIRALLAVEKGARANVVVPDLLSSSHLDLRDRHLVTELVYGTCRMQRACDWLVDRYTRGRTDSEVRCALRLGAYQLAWTRIPSHAAVAATVDEVAGPGRSVVNAVLRRVASDIEQGLVVWPDAATELSYPDWIVDRLSRDLGREDAIAALKTMNEAASATARDDGYIQDRASQMVGAHLEGLLGESIDGCRILDVCAAPGGKATALAGGGTRAERRGPALVVAADLSPSRTKLMASNIRRLGASRVAALVADGCHPCFDRWSFDLVLVDAPCSGLGVLRRRPDARWRIRPEHLDALAGLQRRLLSATVPLVRPGGIIAYSVCTLTVDETAAVDNWLAKQFPDLPPVAPPVAPWKPAGRGGLLLPQVAGTDGMYMLCLRVPDTLR
jgi:16S rRNA (cytosine967-C5)-methyltransferase